jgi:hypothetical protein
MCLSWPFQTPLQDRHLNRLSLIMPAPRLPPELVIRVLEHIRVVDKHDLYACALVCRDWTAIAQARMFSRLKLTDLPRLKRFTELSDRFVAHVRVLEIIMSAQCSDLGIMTDCLRRYQGRLPNVDHPRFYPGHDFPLEHEESFAFLITAIKTLTICWTSWILSRDF